MNIRITLAGILMTVIPVSSFSSGAIKGTDSVLASSPPQITPKDLFGNDWPTGEGRDLTGYICGRCHSLAIVKQQRLSRGDWDEVLDWMVEEHGMAQFDAGNRANILAYLSAHFGTTP